MNKNLWSHRETEVLVDQFIKRKSIINGPLSVTNTKESKKQAWEEIREALLLECPFDKPRDMKEIRKKWNNIRTEARKAIACYKKSISDNDGGPLFALKPIYRRVLEEVFGDTNTPVSSNTVSEEVDTEDDEKRDSKHSIACPSHLEVLVEGESLHLSSLDDNSLHIEVENQDEKTEFPVTTTTSMVLSTTPSPLSGSTCSILPCSQPCEVPPLSTTVFNGNPVHCVSSLSDKNVTSSRPSSQNPSAKEIARCSKRPVCDRSDLLTSKRMMKERFELLETIMKVRAAWGERPFTDDEIPRDMLALLKNPADAGL